MASTDNATPNNQLPFAMRKSIKDTEAKREAHLVKIRATTGIEWTFEPDWIGLVNSESAKSKSTDWVCSAVEEYLSTLAKCVASTSNSDSMVKEEVANRCTNKKILLKVAPGGMAPKISFADGCLVLSIDPKYVWFNVNDMVSIKFEKLL